MVNLAKKILILPIRAYQILVSPVLPSSCRFYPSCSEYACQSIEKYGPLRGFWKACVRLSKCHPFHPGGVDLP